MKIFINHRKNVLSILTLLLLVATLVDAQIAEQDDAGVVSFRGNEDHRTRSNNSSRINEVANETNTDEDTTATEAAVDDHPVAGTQLPTIQRAWIHYFDTAEDTDGEDGALEGADIQGTKEYIIKYKQPDDFSIAEEILAATDEAVQSTVVDNGGFIKYEYSVAMNGVSASLTNEAMQELMKQDGLDFIEEVVPMSMTTTWGQDRVDEKDLTSSKLDYVWERNRSVGDGVNVCVRCVIRGSKNNLCVKKWKLPSTITLAFGTADYRYRCR
jgi:hypothetical protein